MEYLQFLRREAKEFSEKLIFIAVIAGMFNSLLISFVIKAAGEVGKSDFRYLLLIALCLFAFYCCKRYVMDRTSEIVEGIVSRIRLRIADKIRKTSLEVLEKIGTGRLYSAVSTHTMTISQSSVLIVNAITGVFMVAFASIFVISMSKTAFVLTGLLFGWLVFYYSLNQRKAAENHQRCSNLETDYFESFNDLLLGFKELKINSKKGQEFFEERLQQLSEATRKLKVETLKLVNKSVVLSQSSFFVLLAGILFLLPVLAPAEVSNIPAIIAVVLFIFGPVSEIISVYPFLTRANVSIRTIYALEEELDNLLKSQPARVDAENGPVPPFEEIDCRQITFTYRNGADHAFTLGPLDFQLRAGEIVFVVGGNGSGKSTFLKVFSGLYLPHSGAIYLNGKIVIPHMMASYRDLFSPIFSDYHLFDKLYGVPEVDSAEATELISRMDLTDKTAIIERRITNRKLSTGQRKRLALVVSLLEKKPICLFDEWAADQDPEFRNFFYEHILPDLKRQGKTVFAATHDDRYFHVADRVLKLEYGKFVPYQAR